MTAYLGLLKGCKAKDEITNAASILKQHFMAFNEGTEREVVWMYETSRQRKRQRTPRIVVSFRSLNLTENLAKLTAFKLTNQSNVANGSDPLSVAKLANASASRATESGSDRSNYTTGMPREKPMTNASVNQTLKSPAKSRLTNLGLHSRPRSPSRRAT